MNAIAKGELYTGYETAIATAEACRASTLFHSTGERAPLTKTTDVVAVESGMTACFAALGATACGMRSAGIAERGLDPAVDEAQRLGLPTVFLRVSSAPMAMAGLHFFAESHQTLADTMIMAYKIAEDKRVLAPAVISVPSPAMREVVHVPSTQSLDKFLPRLHLAHRLAKEPRYLVPQRTAEDLQNSLNTAAALLPKYSEAYWQRFRRKVGFFHTTQTEDAEHVLVVAGVQTLNSQRALTKLRAEGKKVGVVSLNTLTPFPERLKETLNGKNVAVIENGTNAAQGVRGLGFSCSHYLTHRLLNEKDFEDVFRRLISGAKEERWVSS